jgi:hypothetical protein
MGNHFRVMGLPVSRLNLFMRPIQIHLGFGVLAPMPYHHPAIAANLVRNKLVLE